MNSVSTTQSNASVQLGLFNAIKDLLFVNPVFLLGIIVICVMLTKIVGIPTLKEYIRLSRLGESFFNPNINLIPFSDGFSLGFILNIFLFIPLGFLCPLMSKYYQHIKNTFFIGLGLSLSIEIVQLFTLYRATDIDDLITNVVGTLIGYLCFKFIQKLTATKFPSKNEVTEPHYIRYIPVTIIAITFIFGFFS